MSPSKAVPLAILAERNEARTSRHGLLVKAPATGRWTLLSALTDLDGTANDERMPEYERMSTLGPAREAFAKLAMDGITTGICTARSFGEARQYRDALGITGPIIAENGAVMILPDGSSRTFGEPTQLQPAIRRIEAAIGRKVANSFDLPGLEAIWRREQAGEAPVVLGHRDILALHRSAERFGSCYLLGLTPSERTIATSIAEKMGLAAFGDLLHLIPQGVNKGKALETLRETLQFCTSTVETGQVSWIPLVFGNGKNDLPLFQQALEAGGVAVVVGDAGHPGGYHSELRVEDIPSGTIRLPGLSHGYAIQAALPQVAEMLAGHLGVLLPL